MQKHSIIQCRFVEILYEVVLDGFEYSLSEGTGPSEVYDFFVLLRCNRNTRVKVN
jgi:hypothetical protein